MTEIGARLTRLLGVAMVVALAVLGAALFGPMIDPADPTPSPTPMPAPTAPPAAALTAPTPAIPEPAITPMPAPTATTRIRLIRIEATASLEFLDEQGRKLVALPVIPGERVRFEVINSAGSTHGRDG